MIHVVRVLLSIAGAFVAGVLTLGHYLNRDLPCGEGGGCATVSADSWSAIGPVPVSAIGLAAYVLICLLSTWGCGNEKAQNLVKALTGFGFLASIAFMIRATFFIQATCLWCVASAVLMTLLFLTTLRPHPTKPLKIFPALIGTALLGGAIYGTIPFAAFQTINKVPHNAQALLAAKVEDLVGPDTHIYGREDAPVTLVEFADLQCFGCKRFFPVAKRLVDGVPGLRLAFRHLPLTVLENHKESEKVAILAEIASEEGKYWDYIKLAYELEETDNLDLHRAILEGLAIDADKAFKRLEDPNDPAAKRVKADMAAAEKYGFKQTPTLVLFVPGKRPRIFQTVQLQSVLQESEVLDALASVDEKPAP